MHVRACMHANNVVYICAFLYEHVCVSERVCTVHARVYVVCLRACIVV